MEAYMKILKGFAKTLLVYLTKKYGKYKHTKVIRGLIKNASFYVPKLTNNQKREIKTYYSDFDIDVDYLFHRWYYAVTGEFSAKFIPGWLFQYHINPMLNNTSLAVAWADKNYYDMRFPDITFPKSIIRNINGYYYDNKYRMISKADAINTLKQQEEIVIKPSLSGGGGSDVRLITDTNNIADVLDFYKKDFVVQKKLQQHPILANLNSSSVNIVRIISLLLDGHVYIISASLRVGTPGYFTDNYIDKNGKGMLTIGIDKSGNLKDDAFFSNGEKVDKCHNNEKFNGVAVPSYNEMVDIVKKNHINIPYFKMISWDITSDINGNPVVIEFNLKSQGTVYYQYVNGPLFGDYTDRILNMVKENKRK